jgi:hypothetical protein
MIHVDDESRCRSRLSLSVASDGPFPLPEVFCWRILNQINWIGLKYNTHNQNVSNL